MVKNFLVSLLFTAEKLNLSEAIPSPDKAIRLLSSCTKSTGIGSNFAVQLSTYPHEFVTKMHRHFEAIGELYDILTMQ